MSKIRTRFAPSPTGYLHVGNIRTALINFLYAKSLGGEFILRIDDTDNTRCKPIYKDALLEDLKWLGFSFDDSFNQSDRLNKYEAAKNLLLEQGRLYPCFETSEELEIKRKLQLSRGLPPIYDRAALRLTPEQIAEQINKGAKPHYRFKINNDELCWDDLIKGQLKFHGQNLSDPVVIREDQSMTYMLCSTIDDIDYKISHVIRGEDHISNTAIQIDMFNALNAKPPIFGHLSLIKTKDSKISKRIGGFSIKSLREEFGYEAMAINSFFSLIGSSANMLPYNDLTDLASQFNIEHYSKSPTTYMPEELELINHKMLINCSYSQIKNRLDQIGLNDVNEDFWLAVRPNLKTLLEIKDWWSICYQYKATDGNLKEDLDFLNKAADLLPQDINQNSWGNWIDMIKKETGRKGQQLFMPIRQALTGMDNGPELKNLLPLLSREQILSRLRK